MASYLIDVSGYSIKKAMPIVDPSHLIDDQTYKVCSGCSAIIKETWDHNRRCDLFIDDPLVGWLKEGLGID